MCNASFIYEASIQVRLNEWYLWPKTASEAISECVISWRECAPDFLSDACYAHTGCAHVTCSSWLHHCFSDQMSKCLTLEGRYIQIQDSKPFTSNTHEQSMNHMTMKKGKPKRHPLCSHILANTMLASSGVLW